MAIGDENHTLTQYPSVRQFTIDTGKLGQEKHYICALVEVDVTEALEKIKRLRSPERKVSFLSWFSKLLADKVADHPPVNGIRKGHGAMVVFFRDPYLHSG